MRGFSVLKLFLECRVLSVQSIVCYCHMVCLGLESSRASFNLYLFTHTALDVVYLCM